MRLNWILRLILSFSSGFLASFSLPPFSFTPALYVGLFLLAVLILDSRLRRFLVGFVFMLGYLLSGIYFITDFSLPGYLVIFIYEALIFAVLGLFLIGPVITDKITSYLLYNLRFALYITVFELLKDAVPFGGFPIASFALTQVNSKTIFFSRIGGSLAVVFMVSFLSASFASLFIGYHRTFKGYLSFVISLLIFSISLTYAYFSYRFVAINTQKIAIVQGGGKVGLRAVTQGNSFQVFENAVNETEKLDKNIHYSFILWPEDVVALNGPLAGSYQEQVIMELSNTFNSPIVAGVTQDVGASYFLNEAVLFSGNKVLGTYEKIHRVPFGEYIPYRSFFRHFGPTYLVPRDAISGKKPGVFNFRRFKIGLLISYEVFYENLARNTVVNGANLLVVPTNTASYSSSQAPSQELGADRLRAVETGRFLVQASPTGFSDCVDDDGQVQKVTRRINPAHLVCDVKSAKTLTIYDKLGYSKVKSIFIFALAFSLLLELIQAIRHSSRLHRLNQMSSYHL